MEQDERRTFLLTFILLCHNFIMEIWVEGDISKEVKREMLPIVRN